MSASSTPAALPYDAVLLIAFGGPTAPDEIRPFLANVTRGRPIPADRLEAVAHHYELIGGRSPLNDITFAQARGLQQILDRQGPSLPVFVGMRNWTPYLHETLAEMAARGVRHALGIILSAQQSEAGWGRYQEDVRQARERVGAAAPHVDYTPAWHDHPLFIAAVADGVRQAFEALPVERRAAAKLIFTAHSIPTAMAASSPYVEQIRAGAALAAERAGRRGWLLAYQSRSGSPRDPWLEPDISSVIATLAAEGVSDVVVSPIGFVCDHAEVLYDLDIEARQAADAAHLNFVRAPTVNDHPSFVAMLAELVATACRTAR